MFSCLHYMHCVPLGLTTDTWARNNLGNRRVFRVTTVVPTTPNVLHAGAGVSRQAGTELGGRT